VIGHALKEVQTLPGEVVPLLRFKKSIGSQYACSEQQDQRCFDCRTELMKANGTIDVREMELAVKSEKRIKGEERFE